VFLNSQVELAANLSTGITTYNVESSVPALATHAVLFIRTHGNSAVAVDGRTASPAAWLSLLAMAYGNGDNVIGSVQVIVPLTSARTFQLNRTNGLQGTFSNTQVHLQGYLLPGTTTPTIQSGTAPLPTDDGFASGSVITHGLGFVPPHVRVVLRCTDATNSQGYAAGVELDLADLGANNENSGPPAFHVSVNENTVRVFRTTAGTIPTIFPANGGYATNLDITKWQLKAYWTRVDGVIPSNLTGVVKQILHVTSSTRQFIQAPSNTLYDLTGLSVPIYYTQGSRIRVQGVVSVFAHNVGKFDLVRKIGNTDTVLASNIANYAQCVLDYVDSPLGTSATYRLRLHNLDDGIPAGNNNDTKIINPTINELKAADTPLINPATPASTFSSLTLSEIA